MNTVLQARPRNFVSTPTLERTAFRALRYLRSGYSVHLKGPAGTGKTTLALHLADLLGRPIMLLFGDDEFKTSDLIGNQSGYTRKKVVDNYIHSVMKVEDELRHNWIDSRLTLACREGFTLVYDEFNRSRPEVNNVLLSALEEKLLVLPPNQNRSEYIRVNPHFRAIFTSNPEEYCGVHGTQDALQDRLITINMPEPDELAQQQILIQKVGLEPSAALQIVRLVKAFQAEAAPDMVSSLRPCLMIATICHDHGIPPLAENAEFRDVCSDVLLDRAKHPLPEATRLLWDLFNHFVVSQVELAEELKASRENQRPAARLHGEGDSEMGEALTPPVDQVSIPVATTPFVEKPVSEEPTEAPAAIPAAMEDLAETMIIAEPETLVVAPGIEAPAIEEPRAEETPNEELATEPTLVTEALVEVSLTEETLIEEEEVLAAEAPVMAFSAEETLVAETPGVEDGAAESLAEEPATAVALVEEPEVETAFAAEPALEPILEEPFMDESLTEEAFMDESDTLTEEPFAEEPFAEEPFMDESGPEETLAPEPPATELTESADPAIFDAEASTSPEPASATSSASVSVTLEAASPAEVVAAPVAPPALPSPASLSSNVIETRIFEFLEAVGSASLARIESDLGLTRFQVVNALKSMLDQKLIEKGDEGQLPSVYQIRSERG